MNAVYLWSMRVVKMGVEGVCMGVGWAQGQWRCWLWRQLHCRGSQLLLVELT